MSVEILFHRSVITKCDLQSAVCSPQMSDTVTCVLPRGRDWNYLRSGGGGSVRPKNLKKCMENIITCVLPPRKRLELPEEWGGGEDSVRPKNLKKCTKLN